MLWLDVDRRHFLKSPYSSKPLGPPKFTLGDKLVVDLAPIERSGMADPLYSPVDWSTKTIDFGIFRPGDAPETGGYQLAYSGDETPDLTGSFLGPASGHIAITDAINALPSIAAAGGVQIVGHSATKPMGVDYEVHFKKAGARTAFTATDLGLEPAGEVGIKVLNTGDATERHVVRIFLKQSALVHSDAFVAQPGTALVLETKRAGGVSDEEVQELKLSPLPLGGEWKPTIDGTVLGRIPWDASTAEWARALAAAGEADVDVKRTARATWALYWDQTGDQPDTTADTIGLVSPNVYRATIEIDSAVINADSMNSGPTPFLTIQVSEAGDTERETVFNDRVMLEVDTLNDQTT